MAKSPPELPFLPKSTAYLTSGMFWDIGLRDGSFACGRVIHVEGKIRKRSRFDFWGALLDWHSSGPPTRESIAGAPVLWQGNFDVRSLGETGSQILGILPLDSDGLVIPPILTTLMNGEVMIGYEEKRGATDEEFRTLPIKMVGEGNDSFRRIAEEVFLDGKPMRWTRKPEDNQFLDSIGMQTPADLKRVEAQVAKGWRATKKSKSRTRRRS